MPDNANRTRSLVQEPGASPSVTNVAHLHVVLEGESPCAPSRRHALGGVISVAVGRGDTRGWHRTGPPDKQTLRIDIPDPWMSSNHVVLQPQRGHWVAQDAGSKNGILVDGQSLPRAILMDGTVLQLGRTVLLFREHQVRADSPRDVQVEGTATEIKRGLATLSPALERTFNEVTRIAPAHVPMLLEGPSGSGKEIVAQAVHQLSGRTGPLIPINCGALPDNLVESELFGARKGAFSGAAVDRTGLVTAANGGTLFLDEIGDLPAPAQASLLRVLESGEVRPLGATSATTVNVRIIAATNRNLDLRVEDGLFREDLLARLAGYRLTLPPLAERREDIGVIIAALLSHEDVSFTAAAAGALVRHQWPRNIRELGKSLERAVALALGHEVSVEHLPQEVGSNSAIDGQSPLSEEERERRELLLQLLSEHQGNISAVSRAIGKVRPQVQRWLKRYGIDASSFR